MCAFILSLYTNSLYTHPSSLYCVFGLYWEKLFDQGRRSRPLFTALFIGNEKWVIYQETSVIVILCLYGWMLYNDPFSQSSKNLLYNELFLFVLCFWSILRETVWSGAAKPPHIYWPAFLKLKIELWERIWNYEREFEIWDRKKERGVMREVRDKWKIYSIPPYMRLVSCWFFYFLFFIFCNFLTK